MDISLFKGILEADETYFLYSEKGKRGITYRKPRKRGGVPSLEALAENRSVFLSPVTVRKTPFLRYLAKVVSL